MADPTIDARKAESNEDRDALRTSEIRYRRLFESAKDGILILDARSGLITDVNPFLTNLLDYTREEFIGRTLWDIGAFRQIQASKEAFKELQQREYIRYEDLPLETKSGRRINVEFVSNVYEENGKRVIQCNVRDITERKRADEAREHLVAVVESSDDAIITKTLNGTITSWNPGAAKLFGYSSVEAIGQPLLVLLPPERAREEADILLRIGRGEPVYHLETVRVRKDGIRIDVSVTISPIRNSNGVIVGASKIARDITDRKQAEAVLREYKHVVEGLEEMILVVDRQYRYLLANRAFLNFRGMSADQVVGHTAEEIVGKEVFFALVKQKMDECFLGKPVQYEMIYRFPNLGKRDVFISYIPIEGSAGVERIACVLQDITERKLAEEALRKSEERFSKAFRSNPLAITISTEAEGRYLDVNDAFLDLLGYQRKDVVGRTSADLRFWSEPLDRLEMLRQLKQEERVAKHHTRYRTARGELREAEVWVESIELDGQPCLLGITRDITEIRKLEDQFRQAQKMEAVGRLAGGIAHDFNNILGIIMGYSDISLDLIAPENPATRYVTESKKAAKRAALLTRQLLAFSRKQVVFPRILDLNDVVHNATSLFRQLVGEDIEIEFRPAASIGSIRADPGQIEQVLMNLVVNARDAMPSGGKILIETAETELDDEYVSRHLGACAGKQVVLLVSDTGCGMDETTKARVFEPFFTTKAVGEGTGLGLSTVYGIVKQSAGYILVYSELGKGTTFKMYFPRLAEAPDNLVSSRQECAPPRGSETILVVEDDTFLREITVKLLQDGGYRVLDAKDAEDGLKIVASTETEIDLLLTDVIMPGTSGAELVKQVERARPKIRSLFMSGYTGDLVGRQGVVIHQDSFLEKPFTKRSLLTKVYSVLHRESAK